MMGDDHKDEPAPLVPVSTMPAVVADDPSNDKLIAQLEAEGKPKPKRCPHCGRELPRE